MINEYFLHFTAQQKRNSSIGQNKTGSAASIRLTLIL
jgi:hypothetical protein